MSACEPARRLSRYAAALALALVALAACGARGGRDGEVVLIVPTNGRAPAMAPMPIASSTAARPSDSATVRGIGGVEVGQTSAELRQRLGPEMRVDSFEKEHGAFTTFNYDVDKMVPFILGFDEVLVFNDDTVRSEPPIWKVYMKSDRAVMVKITAVGFDEYMKEHRVGFPPACFLSDPPEGILATFGSSFLKEDLPDHVTYHFVDRGLSVLVFSEAIKVFDVFGDVGEPVREKLRHALTP